MVKNLPAKAGNVRQVRSLGQEEPLEKETATHSSILAWRIRTDRGSWQATEVHMEVNSLRPELASSLT